MFFGGRGKAEIIKSESLYVLLNSLFDKKLGSFKTKTTSMVAELYKTKKQFIDACEKFERLDAEPYTEDLYSVNINFIKGQKDLYAKALKRLMSDLVLKSESATNSYDERVAIISNVDSTVKEVLKTNATFRQVVHCYSNHLGDFKKTFSAIERLTKLLRSELDNRKVEFSEYRAVNEGISRLNSYDKELETLNKNVQTLKKDPKLNDAGVSDKNELDISEQIANKKAELAKVNNELSNLRNKINSLTIPLERSSKKSDHLSEKKKKLHPFIEDPINTVNTESDYNEFKALLQELNKAIDAGAIDIKNRAEVSKSASTLLNSDLYSMINSFKLIQQRRSDMDNKIGVLERDLNSLRAEKEASVRSIREAEIMERKVGEIEKSRASTKSMIEKLFLDYYSKKISIVS